MTSSFDEVIAYLQFRLLDDNTAKMQQVAVRKKNQTNGIGRRLVNHSEQFIKNIGVRFIVLHAREPVIGFYEKLGYQKIGEKFLEVTIPHYKMKKSI